MESKTITEEGMELTTTTLELTGAVVATRLTVGKFVVDYGVGARDAAKVNYDRTDDRIKSEYFATERKGTAEIMIELFYFASDALGHNDVIMELGKERCRPTEIHELLEIGKRYPNLLKGRPIVALGSSCWSQALAWVPCIGEFDGKRAVGLLRQANNFAGFCFAAVREYESP